MAMIRRHESLRTREQSSLVVFIIRMLAPSSRRGKRVRGIGLGGSAFVFAEKVDAEIHSPRRINLARHALLQLQSASVELVEKLGGAAARQLLQLLDRLRGQVIVGHAAFEKRRCVADQILDTGGKVIVTVAAEVIRN